MNKNKKIIKLKNLRKVNKKIISFQNLRRIKIKNSPFGKVLKITFDGSHYIGTEIEEKGPRKKKLTSDLYSFEKQKAMQEKQIYFDELFFLCLNQVKVYKMSDCNRNKELKELLKDGMLERYPDMENIEGYINVQVYRKVKNYYLKEKRLKSKGYLNKWNYFVTFTYDDKKHDEITFRQSLKKCLSNFAYRRGWKYMGVFEESPEKKRLHFHAIMYIPDGEMVGELQTRRDYSTKQKKMQETVYNTFFEKKFGRCDFEEITANNREELKKEIEYMTKYIFKTNEQISYSRGLQTEINTYVENTDIVSTYVKFLRRYVLFDDCIEDNIYKPYKIEIKQEPPPIKVKNKVKKRKVNRPYKGNYKQTTMFENMLNKTRKIRKNSNAYKSMLFYMHQGIELY